MCDYCGCRESGPTAELAEEHVALQELSDRLKAGLLAKTDVSEDFAKVTRLLALHAAKEEVGLFPQVLTLEKLDEQIHDLIHEHDVLHDQLANGPTGSQVASALKLLEQHIEDEEFGLFPHIFHALDPEQWDEIELAHRAVEQVFAEPEPID